MSTREKSRNDKLAAARKELKKFQTRSAQKSSSLMHTDMTTTSSNDHPLLVAPILESNVLLQQVLAAPELTTSINPFMTTSLALTTPTDTPVANGYATATTSGGSSLQTSRPLTPTTSVTEQHSISHNSSIGDNLSQIDHTHNAVSHTHHSFHQLDSHHMNSGNHTSSNESALHYQVQAQTIDILVSEKTSLQSEINNLNTDLRNKTREIDDLTKHLQSTREQLEQNERIKLTLNEDKSYIERTLFQVTSQKEELEKSLVNMKTSLDDIRQENTELISKVTSQANELHNLQVSNTELKSKLTMSELLTQQLSVETPPPTSDLSNQLDELRSEVVRLERLVRSVSEERDQSISDLDALRDIMIQQQQDSSVKMSELHTRLVESEAEKLSLTQQLQDLQQRQDQLEQNTTIEHAQFQQSTQVVMETLQKERDDLQAQLRSQVQETGRLSDITEHLETQLHDSVREVERLRETGVDSQRLLNTITQDKEALSRALTQNKSLKTQLEEIQEAFIRMSQQNMDLATELESEKFHVTQLKKIQLQSESSREELKEEEMMRENEDIVVSEIGIQTSWEEHDDNMTTTTTDIAQDIKLERDTLHHQLQEVLIERDELQQEILQLHTERTEHVHQQSTNDNDRGTSLNDSPSNDTDSANQTLGLLSALQANFNALQERYIAVMADKAELLEQVEERELTIGQLSGETETIGEYIMLYQSQREALRAKFKEKDNFIQQLIREKEAIQAQLVEVQKLMKQLMADRSVLSQESHTPPSPNSHSPPTSPSTLPLHLRQFTTHHHTAVPSSPLSQTSQLSQKQQQPHTETMEQILHMLSVIGESGDNGDSLIGPCTCCTGDIIIV